MSDRIIKGSATPLNSFDADGILTTEQNDSMCFANKGDSEANMQADLESDSLENSSMAELNAIGSMLGQAKDHNLECEVIWSLCQALSNGEKDIDKAASYALSEWDI